MAVFGCARYFPAGPALGDNSSLIGEPDPLLIGCELEEIRMQARQLFQSLHGKKVSIAVDE
jgi:hypothetical protein